MPDIHPNALPDVSSLGGTIADVNVSASANIGWSRVAYSGSRSSLWSFAASFSDPSIGSRFCADHVVTE